MKWVTLDGPYFSPFLAEGFQRTTSDVGVKMEKLMATVLGYLGDYPSLHISVHCVCSVITLQHSRSHSAHASLRGVVGRTRFYLFFCYTCDFFYCRKIDKPFHCTLKSIALKALVMAGTRQNPLKIWHNVLSSICGTSSIWNYFPN